MNASSALNPDSLEEMSCVCLISKAKTRTVPRVVPEKITPDFDTEHIRSIVGFLYDASAAEKANKICNIYGARGQELLRDIYERHSSKA